MAWMNQERKALIAAELKKVVPAGWKYTLAVRNGSTIVMTVTQAPVDIIGEMLRVSSEKDFSASSKKDPTQRPTNMDVNPYYLDRQFDGELLGTMSKIMDALNLRNVSGKGNWDNSDLMTDYFDVGWYVDLNIGSWNRPFLDVVRPEEVKKPFVMKPSGVNAPGFDQYKAFLPEGWATMSPGKKAAATKVAKALAAQSA